jgi:hypothetical protein
MLEPICHKSTIDSVDEATHLSLIGNKPPPEISRDLQLDAAPGTAAVANIVSA